MDWPICGIGGVPVSTNEPDRDTGADPEVVAKMAERDGFERRNGRLKSNTSRLVESAAFSGLRRSESSNGGDSGGLSP
jgi:hypothetical protein